MSAAVPTLPTSISLYYKEGTSNKEYHVQIVGSEEEGYKVNFQYGRVGSSLTSGTKTKAPVDLATAIEVMGGLREVNGKQEYFGLVGEKMRKGYTTGESGTPYQDTPDAGKVAGVLPQLLNFIPEEQVDIYLNDDAWILQEKKDGVRQMAKKNKKTVEGVNKKGLVVSLPTPVEQAIRNACGEANAILDGELIGEIYWLFDMLSIGVHSYADKTYRERLEGIQEWLGDSFSDHLQLVPTAVGKASKKALYAKLKKENAEGVVFKRLDSPYKAGRPASGGSQVKFKFKGSATVRVRGLNNTKNSFQMEMLKAGDWIHVGDCTYYPTQYVPKTGDYVEVEYLYAFPEGSLFQPICKEHRKDVDEGDCLVSQLKYKQGTQADDE
jgi:bifunctional non-homologous end joining protein LigD